MTISYYRVIKVVWTRNRRLSSSAAPESNATITNAKLLERYRKRVLRVLLIVVLCFVICWLPFALYHGILERYLKEYPNPMDGARLITYGLGLANSMCNPFIYYFNVGGTSLKTMKASFVEIMGGRARASSHRSVEINSPLSSPARKDVVPAVNMPELQVGLHSNNNNRHTGYPAPPPNLFFHSSV